MDVRARVGTSFRMSVRTFFSMDVRARVWDFLLDECADETLW
jgi:hypothetical protein